MADLFPKAILLDLDDTILSYGSPAQCWQEVCGRFVVREGFQPQPVLKAILERGVWYWGDPDRHRRGRLDLGMARREVVAMAFLKLGLDNAGLANEIADAYTVAREEALQPFPGAMEALRRLRAHGVKLALLTNGAAEPQRFKVEKFGLTSFFDLILIEGEFGAGKPDARVYRHALEMLGVTPGEAWMVGDNLEWEVAAPQRLGIKGIWNDFAGTGLPEGSDVRPYRIIRSLTELI
ncbi:MAG: HAD family hydrolase [Candidatus Latescibacteria bacterium]|nr:HAD family hydrolase [Candidatus Latescibacterota bacterium]